MKKVFGKLKYIKQCFVLSIIFIKCSVTFAQGTGNIMMKLGYFDSKEVFGLRNALENQPNAELLRINDTLEMKDTVLISKLINLKKLKGIYLECYAPDYFWSSIAKMKKLVLVMAEYGRDTLPDEFLQATHITDLVTTCKDASDFEQILRVKSLRAVYINATDTLEIQRDVICKSNLTKICIMYGVVHFPRDMSQCLKIKSFSVHSFDRCLLPERYPRNVEKIFLEHQSFVFVEKLKKLKSFICEECDSCFINLKLN